MDLDSSCEAYELNLPPESSLIQVTWQDRDALWLITHQTLHKWCLRSGQQEGGGYNFKKCLERKNMGTLQNLAASQTYVFLGTSTGHLLQCSIQRRMQDFQTVAKITPGIKGIRVFEQWLVCWSEKTMWFVRISESGNTEVMRKKTVQLPSSEFFRDIGIERTAEGLVCIIPVAYIEEAVWKIGLKIYKVFLQAEKSNTTTTLLQEDWSDVFIRSVGSDGMVLMEVDTHRVVMVSGMTGEILADISQHDEEFLSSTCLLSQPLDRIWLGITLYADERELTITQFVPDTIQGAKLSNT